MKRIRLSCLALATVAACLAGCSSSNSPSSVSYSAIRNDLTPELATIAQRPIDVDKDLALTDNFNLRMLGSDLGRVFYTNRPSRLSPDFIPSLGVGRN
jgi:hypothetical protein